MSAAGTFAEPLVAGETTCPACSEDSLRPIEYGLLEFTLSRMLESEEIAEFDRRIEVRCPVCGWCGSRLRS